MAELYHPTDYWANAKSGVPSVKICAMLEIARSDEPFAVLHSLVRAWCDRRRLEALNHILPAYPSFNGRMDAWNRLYDALQNLRTSAQSELTDEELEKVSNLITLARRII